MVRGRRPRAIALSSIKQPINMKKTAKSPMQKPSHKTSNNKLTNGPFDSINSNFTKSIETITRRTRNLRKSLHRIQKQFDNQAITKFFQRKLKANVIDINNDDENACDAFATGADSDNDRADSTDEPHDASEIATFNFKHDENISNRQCSENDSDGDMSIVNVDENSNGSGSSHNSIQPSNIFLQKPVLHLNIDKTSKQTTSIVINKHLDKCPNFATRLTSFNGSIACTNQWSAFNTASQINQNADDAPVDVEPMQMSDEMDDAQQNSIGSPKKRCEKPKLRKQMPRKCANKFYSESGLLEAINNSDSNSCDSGVVSDRSFELNSDGGNKPTTPHRIVCPSSTTPTDAVTPQKLSPKMSIDNATNKQMAVKTRGRAPRNATKVNSAKSFFTKLNAIAKSQATFETASDCEKEVQIDEPKTEDDHEMCSCSVVDEVKSEDGTNENQSVRTLTTPQPSSRSATPSQSKPMQSKQMTDFFPVRRSIRKTKRAVEQEFLRHIEKAIEKQTEDGLMVKYFKDKGRGICASRPFARGEFVIEYIGDLIEQNEADRREEIYANDSAFGCYMYYFKHKEQQWCIDATAESGKLGRLVNHSRNGNLVTKIVTYKNRPHLVLIAKDDIKEGEELTYDYGDRTRES